MTWKSEMTPSLSGRTATMFAGVRPTMRFASAPIASTFFVTRSIATTLGSSMTMPRPLTMTSVFAVPRSIPTSWEKRPRNELMGLKAMPPLAFSTDD